MDLKLRQMRKMHDLTQKELAEKLGTTLRVVSSWERGETMLTLPDAARIADVFACTLDELAGRNFQEVQDPQESELVSCYRAATPVEKSALLHVARTYESDGKALNNPISESVA